MQLNLHMKTKKPVKWDRFKKIVNHCLSNGEKFHIKNKCGHHQNKVTESFFQFISIYVIPDITAYEYSEKGKRGK